MDTTTAAEMIEHYFQSTMAPEESTVLETAFAINSKLTPAELEQKCSEHVEIASLVRHLTGDDSPSPDNNDNVSVVNNEPSTVDTSDAYTDARDGAEDAVALEPLREKSLPLRETSVPRREPSAPLVEAVEAA